MHITSKPPKTISRVKILVMLTSLDFEGTRVDSYNQTNKRVNKKAKVRWWRVVIVHPRGGVTEKTNMINLVAAFVGG